MHRNRALMCAPCLRHGNDTGRRSRICAASGDGACEILLAYQVKLRNPADPAAPEPTGPAACEAFSGISAKQKPPTRFRRRFHFELLDTLAKRHDDLHDGAKPPSRRRQRGPSQEMRPAGNDPEVRSLAMELSALETDTLSYDHFMTDRIEDRSVPSGRALSGLQ